MSKSVFHDVNLHYTLYVFVKLFMQVSWVASEQPDDPPKCRLDERTWVRVLSSLVFTWSSTSFHEESLWLLWWYRYQVGLISAWRSIRCLCWVICVSSHGVKNNVYDQTHRLQSRGDGAAYPVLGPVCHAGGDGCIHCSEKGTLKNGILYSSQIHTLYSQTCF